MHILKIIHGYPPTYNAGSEVYSQSLCTELAKRHKVSVFTREEDPYRPDFEIREILLEHNLTLYVINHPQSKDGYRHPKFDSAFRLLVDKLKPDVAHIGHLNHLSTGIVDELHQASIPIVFTLHDFWLMCPRGQFLTRSIGQECNFLPCDGQDNKKCAKDCYSVYFSGIHEQYQTEMNYWTEWISVRMKETMSIIDKVNLFIAPSKYLRDRFIEQFGMPPEKIKYIDYGFPTEYLTKTIKSQSKEVFTFAYIGTHIPAKGVNLLIEAFGKIKGNASLKIFGRPNGQSTVSLQRMASTISNQIEFVGEYINKNLANEVFSHVDCIVVPSIWAENSPLVIHEAQACRIPVITANVGGMKEYVSHKVNGLLFDHRDVDSLIEQLQFALDNQQLMRQLGERGYLYSPDGNVPTISQHSKQLEEIYLEL